jgi:hypothetical protein
MDERKRAGHASSSLEQLGLSKLDAIALYIPHMPGNAEPHPCRGMRLRWMSMEKSVFIFNPYKEKLLR